MPDNAIAETGRQTHPLVLFKEQLEQRAQEIKMALPDHISPEKFQRTVITAVQQNPDLLRVKRTSLVLACMKAAQDGLLPDGREAALVPFKTSKKIDGQWVSQEEAAYIPMVYGVRKKILQARDAEGKPVVSALEVGVVYRKEVEAGHFYYEVGKYPPLGHRPMLDLTSADTTDDQIVGAYSIATMADGAKSYEFMRRFELDKVQNASQTGAKVGRDGEPRDPKGPWKDWYPEMAKKTVLRRHSKSLPQSGDLIIEVDDDDAGTSAALVLGSVSEDEPVAIEDRSEETPHDAETGEVIKDQAQKAEAPEPEAKPARGRQRQAERAEEPNPPAPPPESNDRDELGVTKDPSEAKAEAVLAEMAAATTIIDLDKIYGREEQHIAAMPDDIRGPVDSAYTRHARRLGSKAEASAELAK